MFIYKTYFRTIFWGLLVVMMAKSIGLYKFVPLIRNPHATENFETYSI
jgi:hypothetical protein